MSIDFVIGLIIGLTVGVGVMASWSSPKITGLENRICSLLVEIDFLTGRIK